MKNSSTETTWHKLNHFDFKNRVTWKAQKKVLSKYGVKHNFDSDTAKYAGGFILAALADLVDSGRVTLTQIKKELLCK